MRAISAICLPTVCTGFSAVRGSWKMMAISAPRMWRMVSSLQPRRSRPFQKMPSASIRASGSSPRMLMAVTDLPEPDSPTTAKTSPRWTSKDTPSTARTSPSSVGNVVCRSRTDSSTRGSGRK